MAFARTMTCIGLALLSGTVECRSVLQADGPMPLAPVDTACAWATDSEMGLRSSAGSLAAYVCEDVANQTDMNEAIRSMRDSLAKFSVAHFRGCLGGYSNAFIRAVGDSAARGFARAERCGCAQGSHVVRRYARGLAASIPDMDALKRNATMDTPVQDDIAALVDALAAAGNVDAVVAGMREYAERSCRPGSVDGFVDPALPPGLARVYPWEECGSGADLTGCCEGGYACVVKNEYYAQCRPAGEAT